MQLSDSQQMVRETMRNFAQQRLAPFAAAWDREHAFPRDALRELAALGACGIVVPESYGGAGLDYVSLALALEEIAAGDGATSTVISVQNSVVCGPIFAFGTAAQKDRYLKPLASGAKIGCFCLTEPHTGSDAAAIATRAEFVRGEDHGGGHYVLHISSAHFAGRNTVARHRMVYSVLGEMMKREIHALTITACTPDET